MKHRKQKDLVLLSSLMMIQLSFVLTFQQKYNCNCVLLQTYDSFPRKSRKIFLFTKEILVYFQEDKARDTDQVPSAFNVLATFNK